MTILLSCLVIALLLPFLVKIPLAKAISTQGKYDNHHPRTQQSQLTGYAARALAGHQNAFESLLIFSVAALSVLAVGKVNQVAEIAAVIFIISRIIYHICYLKNFALPRTMAWIIGFISCLVIIAQAF